MKSSNKRKPPKVSAPKDLAKTLSWKEETKVFLQLVIPTITVQLSLTIPPAVTASYIGRILGVVHLDGFTLANTMGNIMCMSLIMGMLSASDTLQPQAFGAGNYREVGLLAVRGYIACLLFILPVNLLARFFIRNFLISLGEDATVSSYATEWYTIANIVSLPFTFLFNVIWKFLSAQEIMSPLLYVTTFSCIVVLPLCLNFFMPRMGYLGTAVANLIYQTVQALLLILYLAWKQPYVADCWESGLCKKIREALMWEPFYAFLKLGFGGILMASEWWYWEVVCGLVGTIDVVSLSIFTVPAQVIQIIFMIPLGIGIALSVRLGSILPTSVERAKALLFWCYIINMGIMAMISAAVYVYREALFRMFTSDAEVLEGCEEIWISVIVYFIVLYFYGLNMFVMTSLGMQWTLGIVVILGLWVFGLPLNYYFGIIQNGGIKAIWWTLSPPYALVNVLLCWSFMTADWYEISAKIRERECMDEKEDIESMLMGETVSLSSSASSTRLEDTLIKPLYGSMEGLYDGKSPALC